MESVSIWTSQVLIQKCSIQKQCILNVFLAQGVYYFFLCIVDVCVCVCNCVSAYVFAYACIYAYVYVYVCAYMYIYACISAHLIMHEYMNALDLAINSLSPFHLYTFQYYLE